MGNGTKGNQGVKKKQQPKQQPLVVEPKPVMPTPAPEAPTPALDKNFNLSDSIGIGAVVIAILLWVIVPNLYTKVLGLILAAGGTALLAYRSHWTRSLRMRHKHVIAVASALVILTVGAYSLWPERGLQNPPASGLSNEQIKDSALALARRIRQLQGENDSESTRISLDSQRQLNLSGKAAQDAFALLTSRMTELSSKTSLRFGPLRAESKNVIFHLLNRIPPPQPLASELVNYCLGGACAGPQPYAAVADYIDQLAALVPVNRDNSDAVPAAENTKTNRTQQSLPGMALYMAIRINHLPVRRRQYVFDFGKEDGERLSLYISPDDIFTVSFQDTVKESHAVQVPLGDAIPVGVFTRLSCQFGVSGNATHIGLRVDGKDSGALDLPFRVDIATLDVPGGVVGADLNGNNGASFDLRELLVYSRTLTREEDERDTNYLKGHVIPQYIQFSGTQWMRVNQVKNHDLSQLDKAHSPTFRDR